MNSIAILCGNRAAALAIKSAGESDLRFGILEHRVLRGDDQIAHLHDHVRAADAPAVHGGDDRLVQLDTDARHALPHFSRGVLDVGTHRECAIAGGGQHGDQFVAVGESLPRARANPE